MTTPLTENPAVLNPRAALTPNQRDALGAISFFRHQVAENRGWRIGNKRFGPSTIIALERLQLIKVKPRGPSLDRISLTQAGKLAHDRLKGGH